MAKSTKKSGAARAKKKPDRIRSRKKIAEGQAGAALSHIHPDTCAYNATQSPADKQICDLLADSIARHLKVMRAEGVENKIWHRHPVWFLEGNPIVGYHKLKDCVRLLFWSGRSFDEPSLEPEGGFQTAGARYTAVDQISASDLKRWIKKAIAIQWDYKNIVKRKGRLERLK